MITLTLFFIILDAILLLIHIYYYKLSAKENRVAQWSWLPGRLFFSPKAFFPVSIQFKDDPVTVLRKRRSNRFLYAFYICFMIACGLVIFIEQP